MLLSGFFLFVSNSLTNVKYSSISSLLSRSIDPSPYIYRIFSDNLCPRRFLHKAPRWHGRVLSASHHPRLRGHLNQLCRLNRKQHICIMFVKIILYCVGFYRVGQHNVCLILKQNCSMN